MVNTKIYEVLFLCTGNSARSIMAEAALNRLGAGKFKAYSAGSHPTGQVHPLTLDLLNKGGFRTESLRSKSWDEFGAPDAPGMDFVFTVCDKAAGEVCPVWPGQPITAHWGFEDPAAFEGDAEERAKVFRSVLLQISTRIQLFISLPFDKLDRLMLRQKVREIGQDLPCVRGASEGALQ